MGFLSGITDSLFGTAPKVKSSQQGTMTPEQQLLLKTLAGQYQAHAGDPGGGAPQGHLSGLENTSLAGLEQLAMGLTGGAKDPNNPNAGTKNSSVSGTDQTSSMALSALRSVFSSGPADFNSFFDTSIANPAEKNFTDNILPGIRRAYAGSGGTGGEGERQVELGVKNLGDSLTQQRASTGYQAFQQNIANKLSAVGLTPQTEAGQYAAPSARANLLQTLLGAGGIQRNVDQTNFSNQVTMQQLMQGLLGQHSFENVNSVLPGTTGIIPGVLQGAAQGFGSAAGRAAFT